MSESSRELRERVQLILELDGRPLIDWELASIMRLIEEWGSLLKACRLLGVPYSRAWERISRAERLAGFKLVIARRGGAERGGMRLTEEGKRLLQRYLEAERRILDAYRMMTAGEVKAPDLTLAHSHDILLTVILDRLRSEELDVEDACIGSGLALASLSLGECDVAASHLYDPDTGEYNRSFLKAYWLTDRVEVIGGYMRELVFAYRPGLETLTLEETLKGLIEGKLRLINRNRGSGTRVYLDHLLRPLCGDPSRRVRGYDLIAYTHSETARAVVSGRADVCLTLRHSAEVYGLEATHVTWERYEYIALRERLKRRGVQRLRELLSSDWLKNLIGSTPGYKPLPLVE